MLEKIKTILKLVTKSGGFDTVLKKVRPVSVEAGRLVCEMTVDEEHCNRGGNLHGGLTATLVDTISTLALMTTATGAPGVSVDMNITYLKAAKLGEDIVIDATTLRAGRRLAFLSVDIKNKSDDSLLAQGRHTKFITSD